MRICQIMNKTILNAVRLVIVLAIFLLTGVGQAVAQSGEGCVKDKCHADMGTKKFVHGPVGAGICTICHQQVEGKKHKFQFTADKDQLCFGCHETSRDMLLQEHVHTPVEDGNCVGCHDPHQSDNRFTLKEKASELCFKCHKTEDFNKKFVHGPVGVGDCNVCHNPHASNNVKQLISPPETICFNCHKEQENIPGKRHVHAPVAEKCTNCHDPHSNKAEFMLESDSPELCYGCHEDFKDYVNIEHKHPPVAEGNCSACHDSHASDFPRMFPRPQKDLCFFCHEEMAEFVNNNDFKHGPVKEGDCSACHDPHGSSNFRMLHHYFPEEFYKPYATENYALCFECHNKDIALDEKTSTLTDFRDGNVNMHYKHVNKDVKGRSCKACHEVHASNQAKHIRKSVPFGDISWELPINYTVYDDGGRCVVGCHAPKEYHRK